MIRPLFWVSSVFLLLLTAAACGAEAEPTAVPEPTVAATVAAPTAEAPAEEATTTTEAVAPVMTVMTESLLAMTENSITTTSGLQYNMLVTGTGDAPQIGDIVSVHYTGTLTNGQIFDSSYGRGEPIQFALGVGQVIPGWDEGIGLLRKGGKAVLTIPPALAYGERGAGGVIPPNATLIFQVELVDFFPGAPNEPTAVDEANYQTTESGLKYYDFVEGDGPSPTAGQMVIVNYTGWLPDGGGKFDSSLDRGQPFTFIIGQGQVIPGWDEGVISMKVGGKRQLVIPPDLAYGDQGAGGVIPPNATLIFDVELLDVQ